MRRRPRFSDLQRQLLLWASVVAVAVSLLAMHQLSGGHTAADPTPKAAAHLGGPGGHIAAEVGFVDAARSTDHAHGADQVHAGVAALGSGSSTPANDGCPGCGEHQAMALTCLVALTLLATGWLLAGPSRWPILLPRRWARALPQDLRRRCRPPSLSLVELSVSRT